ncbi:MAG: serine hydrolase [Planctomycetes bacterium]|nr:serine hydrolase [Planctomycetota bacterium]
MRSLHFCPRPGFALMPLAVLALVTAAHAQSAPAFDWVQASPEGQGMSSARLNAIKDSLAATTKALLVVRNDKLIYEWCAEGRTAKDKHSTASMAKAIVGGLSLAVAITDGLMSIDDRAAKYVPQWKDDPAKSQIAVRHLGSHTSGIQDGWNKQEADRGVDQNDFSGWEGDFWRWRGGTQPPSHNAFTLSRDVAPVLFTPGSDFHYSNTGIAMLTYCVTEAIKGTSHTDVRTLLRERIMRPIGIPDDEWSCGYGKTEVVDGLPLVANWGGGNYTPRAVARIGRLVLRQGDWDGKRLLSEKAVRDITADAGFPGHCGMGWWTNAEGRYPKLPRDAVYGAGAGDQLLLVVPSLNLIMVRNGATIAPPPKPPQGDKRKLDVIAEYHDQRAKLLFEPLIEAVIAK